MSGIVWTEGRLEAADGATPRVPLDDRGYLLGDGVFATMRAEAGRCLRAAEHIAGLVRGADLLGLELRETPERIAELAREVASKTGVRATVRVTLTRGGRLSILGRPFDEPRQGIAAVTIDLRRRAPLDPVVKTTSYALEIAARREAEARGATEAIQLGAAGELACGAMANLFAVVKDALCTPSLASGCRDGVTRRAVMALAPALGLEVREERLGPALLGEAREVFVTNARVLCLGVHTVDGRVVSTSYPVATALCERLLA